MGLLFSLGLKPNDGFFKYVELNIKDVEIISLVDDITRLLKHPQDYEATTRLLFGVPTQVSGNNFIALVSLLEFAGRQEWIFNDVNEHSVAYFEILLLTLKSTSFTDFGGVSGRAHIYLAAITHLAQLQAKKLLDSSLNKVAKGKKKRHKVMKTEELSKSRISHVTNGTWMSGLSTLRSKLFPQDGKTDGQEEIIDHLDFHDCRERWLQAGVLVTDEEAAKDLQDIYTDLVGQCFQKKTQGNKSSLIEYHTAITIELLLLKQKLFKVIKAEYKSWEEFANIQVQKQVTYRFKVKLVRSLARALMDLILPAQQIKKQNQKREIDQRMHQTMPHDLHTTRLNPIKLTSPAQADAIWVMGMMMGRLSSSNTDNSAGGDAGIMLLEYFFGSKYKRSVQRKMIQEPGKKALALFALTEQRVRQMPVRQNIQYKGANQVVLIPDPLDEVLKLWRSPTTLERLAAVELLIDLLRDYQVQY